MQVNAILRNAQMSAQKARLVADQIRGMQVEKALELLGFSSRKASRVIKKSIGVCDSERRAQCGCGR